MYFSFTSFLVSQVSGSILICIWCLILNNKKTLNSLNLNAWFLITPLILIRMLIPFEFSYTVTILSEEILPPVAKFFYKPVVEEKGIDIAAVAIVLWFGIAAGIHLCKLYQEQKTYRLLMGMAEDSEEETCLPIIEELGYKTLYEKRKIAIVKSGLTSTPAVFYGKRTIILLPELAYTNQELSYILDHEFTHLIQKDFIYLRIVNFINSVLWWNPFVYLFRNEFSKLLEMRVDHILMEKYDRQQQAEYLDCIVKTYKYQVHLNQRTVVDKRKNVLAFARKKESTLVKRMGYLMSRHSKKFSAAISVGFMLVCLLTTCFVFEPYFELPNDGENYFVLEEKNDNYFVHKGGDVYDMYIGGEYVGEVENADELEDEALKALPIYNSLDEVEE